MGLKPDVKPEAPPTGPASQSPTARRQRWMGVLAKATRADLQQAAARLPNWPTYRFLRAPETGLAMVRGRIGGTGSPFNFGEMTMTRCAVALMDGDGTTGIEVIGHAFVAGRDQRHAELAAVIDAMLQQDPDGPAALLVEDLAREAVARRARAAAEIAPTRVEFFTMVRE